DEVIAENKKTVEDYLKGKENAIMFLVGQVMKKTKGRANPAVINEILKRKLLK
ncbi:MAG: Asp-tRNA(Asn)/Glu-tRNA(Gln) amidotransferase GatCAB subunit B, partial [Candidatus Omnitrophota bacterium]